MNNAICAILIIQQSLFRTIINYHAKTWPQVLLCLILVCDVSANVCLISWINADHSKIQFSFLLSLKYNILFHMALKGKFDKRIIELTDCGQAQLIFISKAL